MPYSKKRVDGEPDLRTQKRGFTSNEHGQTCSKCKTFKPYNDYHKDKVCASGYKRRCIGCRHEERVKRYYDEKEEKRDHTNYEADSESTLAAARRAASEDLIDSLESQEIVDYVRSLDNEQDHDNWLDDMLNS